MVKKQFIMKQKINHQYPLRYAGFVARWKNARSALYSFTLIDTHSQEKTAITRTVLQEEEL